MMSRDTTVPQSDPPRSLVRAHGSGPRGGGTRPAVKRSEESRRPSPSDGEPAQRAGPSGGGSPQLGVRSGMGVIGERGIRTSDDEAMGDVVTPGTPDSLLTLDLDPGSSV